MNQLQKDAIELFNRMWKIIPPLQVMEIMKTCSPEMNEALRILARLEIVKEQQCYYSECPTEYFTKHLKALIEAKIKEFRNAFSKIGNNNSQ